MRPALLPALAGLLALAPASFTPLAAQAAPREVDSYVTQALRRFNQPGVAIAVVKEGKVVFQQGWGVRAVGRPERVTEQSVFQVASNSKAVTAAALAILVDEGKLRWDDPVTSVSGTTLQSPLAGFGLPDTRYDWPNPTKIIPAFGVHCYSNRIRCFQIKPNPGDQTLQLEVTLQGPIGRTTMGQKSTAEIVESSVLLKCENTWPKL